MEHGGYNVFVRTWWRYEYDNSVLHTRRIVPGAGKRRYMARGVTYERARELCKQYNDSHDPGFLSRKAEFEQC